MRENHEVCVVGHNRILNELLASAIERELGLVCVAADEMPPLGGFFEVWEVSPTILLVDDGDPAAKSQLMTLLADGDAGAGTIATALFNVVRPGLEILKAAQRGMKGVFFASDSLTHLLSGIQLIAAGSAWIPRDIAALQAVEPAHRTGAAVERAGLTMREVEILAHVARGATNEQIAAELFISPHTVKTHVYNLFRKLGVNNRLRATLWAAEHLRAWPGFEPGSGGVTALAV